MEIKKILSFALSVTITLFTATVQAQSTTSDHDKQNKLNFSVGFESGVSAYSMSYYSTFALGGYARLQYYVTNSTALMLTSGYTNSFGRHYITRGGLIIDNRSYGMIPVKIGIKEFISPNFYVAGEAGTTFGTVDRTNGNKNRLLVLSPGVGYVQSNSGLNLGLHYDSYSGSNNAGYGLTVVHVGHDLTF